MKEEANLSISIIDDSSIRKSLKSNFPFYRLMAMKINCMTQSIKKLQLPFILLIVVFINSLKLQAQNTCTTVQNGNWNVTSTWNCDPSVANPPTGSWSNGSILTINHDITIPNNTTINLSTSGTTEIRLNGSISFGANAKLILPSGAKIIFAPGATITAQNNSNGTLIEIGGNGVWGRNCQDDGCSNDELTGPGTLDENSNPLNPLPIELISFTANPQGKNVLLSWATASELNNDYFTLEKSRNGKEFEVLTKVDGNGTTHIRTDYQFTDQNPFLGLSYYRLRQTDYDGTSETFPAVGVLFTASDQFSVFPNPIKDQTLGIKISGRQKNEILELNMFNLQGRLILKQQFVADALGYLDTTLDAGQQLDKGAYILELVSATGKEHIKVQYE
jgi:hypothetical protein